MPRDSRAQKTKAYKGSVVTEFFEPFASQLVYNLQRAVKTINPDSILFSGGVDTSILAALLHEDQIKKAVTVTLEASGEDLKHAETVSGWLKLPFEHLPVTREQAIDAIPNLIKILRSFDPALPNDLVVYFGIRRLKEYGMSTVVTGDGADELFAGYDFMQNMPDVASYIQKIAPRMVFSSNVIGKHFGLSVVQPFLDPDLIRFALTIPNQLKIRYSNGKTWGKWILRKAFETLLPPDIVWQTKRPLEYGSGMHRLRQIIESKVVDNETNNHYSNVGFINKEHRYYHAIYRQVIGEVPGPKSGQKQCGSCGSGMDTGAFHCRVCGNVLDWRQ